MTPTKTDARMDAKVLRRAAELVEMGHCKGRFAQTEKGELCDLNSARAAAWCLVAAHSRAASELGVWSQGLDAVRLVLSCPFDLAGWNDAPERTADDVAAALRAAAARCEANGA